MAGAEPEMRIAIHRVLEIIFATVWLLTDLQMYNILHLTFFKTTFPEGDVTDVQLSIEIDENSRLRES